jgi:predicted dehydrogenase
MSYTRRTFLTTSMGAAFGARLAARVQGANDRIRVGTIGTGGRGRYLMNQLKKLSGAEITTVCDVYEPNLQRAAQIAGPGTATTAEYRRVLDNRDIDAVIVAAPDHWHKTMALDAVAAGKDVYCEKPVSHTIEEGDELVRTIEASNRVVQTGTQQRSWDLWQQGKQIVDSGRLGQITFVHTYWYQSANAGEPRPVDTSKLDWRAWLGPAPDQPFDARRFEDWRHYWDFGGGQLTDLMTHWIDVVHWYMNVEAPLEATATGGHYRIKAWDAPDTVNATLPFPRDFMAVYLGSYVGRVDDGGLEFRGDQATMKIDRARLAIYRNDAPYVAGTNTPAPDLLVQASGDGTAAHIQNWLDCIRSRAKPNADIRTGVISARTSHIANAALRAGRRVRWNATAERVESEPA